MQKKEESLWENLSTQIIDVLDYIRDTSNDKEIIIGLNIFNGGERVWFNSSN